MLYASALSLRSLAFSSTLLASQSIGGPISDVTANFPFAMIFSRLLPLFILSTLKKLAGFVFKNNNLFTGLSCLNRSFFVYYPSRTAMAGCSPVSRLYNGLKAF